MKRKSFLPPFFLRLHLFFALAFSLLLFSACNNKTEPAPNVEDWLNLTIKFKDNSTEAIRDISMRTIENFIADSVEKMNIGDYKDFHPKFVRTSDPRDTLTISLSVGFRDKFGRIEPPTNVMSAPAPCLCYTECRICRLAKVLITTQALPVPAFSVSDYIISTETTHEHQKDSTKKNE